MNCDGSDLCAEFAGEADTEYGRTYGVPAQERLLGSTQNIVVVADLSPLAVGHILVAPRQHYLSFASVLADHEDEARNLLEALAPAYRAEFGSLTVVEHGSSSTMDTSACISHAHLHLVPLEAPLVDAAMTADGLEHQGLTDIGDLRRLASTDTSYFYVGGAVGHRVYGLGQAMPRQYLRRVVAQVLYGAPDEYDWAARIRKDVHAETIRRAGPAVGSVLD